MQKDPCYTQNLLGWNTFYTCKLLQTVNVVFDHHFIGIVIYKARCLTRLQENWLLFPNLCSLTWLKHFNSPSFCSSSHKPTMIHFVFLAKGKLHLVLLYMAKRGSFLGSDFSQYEIWHLKRDGQWESFLVCAGSSFCLFLCDKAPPKIRAWCIQTQRQSALRFHVIVKGWNKGSLAFPFYT